MKESKTITDLLLSGPTDDSAEREKCASTELLEEVEKLRERVKVLETLVLAMQRFIYPQVINPPLVDYGDVQKSVIECDYKQMRERETRRLINELRAISEKANPPE